jgi:hypothetical protein
MEFILDVSSQPEDARTGLTAALADRVESFVKSKFPPERGCRFSRRTSKPFQERKHLLGHHVFVQKGFLWGSEIRVLPDDFQVRRIKVRLISQPRVNEIGLAVSAVLGLLAGVGGAVVAFQMSTSDTVRNVALAFFLGFLVVGGGLIGLSSLLSKALSTSFTDPVKDEREREAFWQELLPVLKEGQPG